MISIRFPMTRERTGRRTGPRYRRVVDRTGLFGAAFCAATSVGMALREREHAKDGSHVRIHRLGMRIHALWARVFAGQIDSHDPRLDVAMTERTALIHGFCAEAERSAA